MTHTTNRLLLLITFCAVSISCSYNAEKGALKRLDDTIKQKEVFNDHFKNRLEKICYHFQSCTDNDRKWELAHTLHKEYLSYDIDSAYVYSDHLMRLAETPERQMAALRTRVSCLCALREYATVENMLSMVDTTGFNDQQRYSYYNAHVTLYTSLGNEFRTDESKARENILKRYRYQSMLVNLPILSEQERMYLQGKQLMLEQRHDEALKILHEVLGTDKEISSRLHTTYAKANCYNALGDRSSYKRWLAETAIYDLQRQNRQYRSLYDLALCLYKDGNYRKAGEYIQITLMDAMSCKHDTRIINAVEAQMIISASGEESSKTKRWILVSFSCIMLVAIIIISIMLGKVNRQRRRLKVLMQKTKKLNHELSKKNGIISEANLIKEKYMFKYMYLSANFIKEMDEYRHDLRHTYKEKGIEALMQKLREPEYIYMQYKAFYKLFDQIFLSIFPDFPAKVNSLMKTGKQITMKHKDTMPTELRILAVIRLGITESRKIAEFLNTSVNTIYTYRTKMRYDSLEGPETFEESIKNIDYYKV